MEFTNAGIMEKAPVFKASRKGVVIIQCSYRIEIQRYNKNGGLWQLKKVKFQGF
jgi:hypothetical protein